MTPTKIYIAGKISGKPKYKSKFQQVQDFFESQGHIVLNPAILPEGLTKADYMRMCFAMIDSADLVFFLQDCADSEGALLEKAYCAYIGKPIV